MIFRAALFLFCLLLTSPAWADEYVEATPENLAHALVRFGAIDTKDDTILDEYTLVTDCDIIQNYYDNDFQWSRVRGMVRDSIKATIATFPTGFHYDAKLQLDRYDFKSKIFRFTAKSAVLGVNSFNFKMPTEYSCGDRGLRLFPKSFTMITDTPISIRGLELSEEDGKALLQRLEQSGNDNRIVYTRFNLRIVKIDPLHRIRNGATEEYVQEGTQLGVDSVRFDVRLDSVDFYEDEDRTKLIYTHRP